MKACRLFTQSFSLLVLFCLLLAGCVIAHRGPDARADAFSEGSVAADGQDAPPQDSPVPDTTMPDESSPDVVPVDEGVDAMSTPDAETGVDAPVDSIDTGVDAGMDAVVPDVVTDTVDVGSDVIDVVVPADVRPDVPVDTFVPPMDVPMPMDSGPLPVARYEFFMASSADATATDPMHLKYFDGSSWTLVTCMNTGSTVMETVPGSAPQWRRCDTDTLYRRFIFDYRSTLGGAPETRDTIGGGGCRVRAGFTARISQYDRSSGTWVQIATHSDLVTDCSGVYWQHQLPDSSIRDF